jgi:hypothetical protein
MKKSRRQDGEEAFAGALVVEDLKYESAAALLREVEHFGSSRI